LAELGEIRERTGFAAEGDPAGAPGATGVERPGRERMFNGWAAACGEEMVDFRLLYWGAFHRVEWQDVDNMDAMMVTTERTFKMAIENIGFLLAVLEKNCLGEWRKALGHGG